MPQQKPQRTTNEGLQVQWDGNRWVETGVIAKIGPACYLAGSQVPPYPSKSYPVTNAQGKVAYFPIIPRDLLRHLGVIIKE